MLNQEDPTPHQTSPCSICFGLPPPHHRHRPPLTPVDHSILGCVGTQEEAHSDSVSQRGRPNDDQDTLVVSFFFKPEKWSSEGQWTMECKARPSAQKQRKRLRCASRLRPTHTWLQVEMPSTERYQPDNCMDDLKSGNRQQRIWIVPCEEAVAHFERFIVLRKYSFVPARVTLEAKCQEGTLH
jgi:hypothetical protein